MKESVLPSKVCTYNTYITSNSGMLLSELCLRLKIRTSKKAARTLR